MKLLLFHLFSTAKEINFAWTCILEIEREVIKWKILSGGSKLYCRLISVRSNTPPSFPATRCRVLDWTDRVRKLKLLTDVNVVWGRTQTTWPFEGEGGVRQNTTSNHDGGGGLTKNHVTFSPHFCIFIPYQIGNCHLRRALKQATTTLWEEEVEKDSIF